MDFLGIGIGVVVLGAVALVVTYKVRQSKVRQYLTAIENPEPFSSMLPVSDSMRQIRGVLKNDIFSGKSWSIKEDNPKGMIMAVVAFDEDLGTLSAAAKRQIILTVSVKSESESSSENEASTHDHATTVRLMYNVYATFGRISADAILKETTESIKKALS